MANRLITWARNQTVGDPLAKALLLLLADIADADGTCFPNHRTLAEDAELSRSSVQRKLAMLVAKKLIRVEPAYETTGQGQGRRTSNSYTLLADEASLRPSGRPGRDGVSPAPLHHTDAGPPPHTDAGPPPHTDAGPRVTGEAAPRLTRDACKDTEPLSLPTSPQTPHDAGAANGVRKPADAADAEAPQEPPRRLVAVPPELRAAVGGDPALGEAWAVSWLDGCRYDPEARSLHARSPLVRGRIRDQATRHLTAHGVSLGALVGEGGRVEA